MPDVERNNADFVAKAHTLYSQVERVKRDVNVRAAGFALGDLSLTLSEGSKLRSEPITVEQGLLRRIGIELCVDGSASASLDLSAGGFALCEGDDLEFIYRGSSSPSAPLGGLGSLVTNYDILIGSFTNPHMAQIVRSGSLWSSTLPVAILDPMQAPSVPCQTVENTLGAWGCGYIAGVIAMRDMFASQLWHHFRARLQNGLVAQGVNFEPDWRAGNSRQGGEIALGYAYQAFKSEGVELQTLRQGVLQRIAELAQLRVIPRSDLGEVQTAFGG
jgi:hypothetical protein